MKRLSGSVSIGRAALAALERQSRNVMHPGATPRNVVQPNLAAGKTNPTPPTPPTPASRGREPPRELRSSGRPVVESALHDRCNAMQPPATSGNALQRDERIGKTNPPPSLSQSRHSANLTPRQLAAARLIAAGQRLPQVALHLDLNRSTVWRWSCLPDFQAELARLHRQWSCTLPSRHER